MSVGDWEEVKRLAADFQRAQLSSSVQRLSERNCVEIINKLIESKQLEVVFTTDGKEYITPQHLIKEIKDELFVHNGRINLVELAKILSVDLSIISSKASEIEKSNASVSIINGQLIDNSYILFLCKEINEKLKLKGQITIAELSSAYDLPSNFLITVVERQLGKTIHAQQDKHDHFTLLTDDFKKRNLSLVKGALIALTKPTLISTVLSLCNIEERLFYSIISTLNENKEVPGAVTAKEGTKSVYIPSIYMKSQSEWVKNFYSQNGYLEFNALSRLGISNPITFIKKHFPDSNILMLASCAIGPLIFDQVEAAIEDAITSASFINILTILPSVAEKRDAEIILNQIVKKRSFQNLHIFNRTVVFTDQYLKNLMKMFDPVIEKKSREIVTSGAYLKYMLDQSKSCHKNILDSEKHESKADRKEERRKKAAEGKGGGGVQGRETKTKSTKKKYLKHLQADYDDENDNNGDGDVGSDDDRGRGKKEGSAQKFEIIKLENIKEILNTDELLEEEDSEELIEEIARALFPKLHKSALEAAKTMYESTIAASNQDRRKKHSEMQDKINNLVLKVKLFEKGCKQFNSKDIQQQLSKYLLKSICTDITNEIFAYVAQDNSKFEGKEMTNEVRIKLLQSIPNDMRETLTTLNKSLTSSSLDDFLNVIDDAVGPGICDIILKKHDKRKERPHLLEQRQQLIDQLNIAKDPALVLHLSCLIIFQEVTQTMIHASGRFVSTILTFLQPSLPIESYNVLQRYHDSVLKVLTASETEDRVEAEKYLNEEMPLIKEITVSFKKNSEKTTT